MKRPWIRRGVEDRDGVHVNPCPLQSYKREFQMGLTMKMIKDDHRTMMMANGIASYPVGLESER